MRDGYFVKDGVRYKVATLDATLWQRVSFSDNDLAWVRKDTSQVLAMNWFIDPNASTSTSKAD